MPGVGLEWNTNFLAINGSLSIALGAVQPQIGRVLVDRTNVVLKASGGAAGYSCSVLTSTNLALQRSDWTVAGSGTWDAGGGFSFTNGISSVGQRFYIFRIP